MTTADVTAGAPLLEALTEISAAAAMAVLRVSVNREVRTKADGSPVTAADEAAEAVICEGLARVSPGLPVISEERAEQAKPITGGRSVVLVDPLDGTRDYIAGRDEYTINIALVTDGVPVLGVITAPALGLVWRGIVGRGAERLEFAGDGQTAPPRPIHVRQAPDRDLTVMVSRSHLDARTKAYLAGLSPVQLIPCGSALKFCRLAEGAADHYPRLAPTRDWDVAAGHAILEAAGGRVIAPDGELLAYGTPELKIPGFLAWGDPVTQRLVRD